MLIYRNLEPPCICEKDGKGHHTKKTSGFALKQAKVFH